jgi:hypothetical protein
LLAKSKCLNDVKLESKGHGHGGILAYMGIRMTHVELMAQIMLMPDHIIL